MTKDKLLLNLILWTIIAQKHVNVNFLLFPLAIIDELCLVLQSIKVWCWEQNRNQSDTPKFGEYNYCARWGSDSVSNNFLEKTKQGYVKNSLTRLDSAYFIQQNKKWLKISTFG